MDGILIFVLAISYVPLLPATFVGVSLIRRVHVQPSFDLLEGNNTSSELAHYSRGHNPWTSWLHCSIIWYSTLNGRCHKFAVMHIKILSRNGMVGWRVRASRYYSLLKLLIKVTIFYQLFLDQRK